MSYSVWPLSTQQEGGGCWKWGGATGVTSAVPDIGSRRIWGGTTWFFLSAEAFQSSIQTASPRNQSAGQPQKCRIRTRERVRDPLPTPGAVLVNDPSSLLKSVRSLFQLLPAAKEADRETHLRTESIHKASRGRKSGGVCAGQVRPSSPSLVSHSLSVYLLDDPAPWQWRIS